MNRDTHRKNLLKLSAAEKVRQAAEEKIRGGKRKAQANAERNGLV